MSEFYKPNRVRNIYNPASTEPFKLSRSKIELYTKCPKCFYMDRRLGVGQIPPFPFSLNTAVDTLLKKEFDFHRANGTKHPMMHAYGLDMIPFKHEKMDEWRENFKGVQHHHQPTNFIITGAVDDLWINSQGQIVVVDYKATSKPTKVTLDAEWQKGYKRQMEIYQWLLRQSGFEVADTGYFVYCNGKADRMAFDARLEFDIDLLPYTGDASWVDQALLDIKACLDGEMPEPAESCDHCTYRKAANAIDPA